MSPLHRISPGRTASHNAATHFGSSCSDLVKVVPHQLGVYPASHLNAVWQILFWNNNNINNTNNNNTTQERACSGPEASEPNGSSPNPLAWPTLLAP